jgi:DNA-binding CsgD family transcriptional regulator
LTGTLFGASINAKVQFLTTRDWKDIIEGIWVADSQLEPTVMRHNILHWLQKVFKIERANFFLNSNDWKSLDLTNVVSLGINPHYYNLFSHYYYRIDPFLTALPSRKVVATVNIIASYSLWTKLEYYNDFLKPQNIHHELAIYLRSGRKFLGMIALFRPKEYVNFSQMELLKARILAPHFATALQNASLFSKIGEETKLLRTATEFPLLGILLLNYELRPVYWNSKAEQICLSLSHKPYGANGLESDGLPIPFDIQHDCSALKEFFKRANQIAPLSRIRTMYAGGGKRFAVRTCLIQQPSQTAPTPCFLLCIEDLSETDKIREEAAKKEYHLTKREMEVCQLASQGLTNEEIARKLLISRLTTETHLKNIFEKVGVRNRVELIGRVQLG